MACIEHIAHPIRVARKVMEDTPHVLLVGEGALQFALEKGFTSEDLLTPEAEQAWRAWLKEARYQPVVNSENIDYRHSLPGGKSNHDTIGMLAVDGQWPMAGHAPPAAWPGSCTAAWATARSSVPGCTWTTRWVARPRPAWARRSSAPRAVSWWSS